MQGIVLPNPKAMASQTPIPTALAVSRRAAADPTPTGTMTVNSTVAMTTPFVVPTDCLDFNGGTMYTSNYALNLITQDSAVRQRSSCLPSGAVNATYLPAVCPSGWKYFSIIPATTYTQLTTSGSLGRPVSLTSAFCCPPYYSMDFATFSFKRFGQADCTRYIDGAQITSVIIPNGGAANQTVYTSIHGGAVLVYPAWQITWASEDAATLLPEPPSIVPHLFVPTWTPGEKAQQYNVDGPTYGGGGIATAALVTAIVVPIILLFSALAAWFCCVRSRRRKQRLAIEKEEREASEQATASGAAAATIATQQSDQAGTTRDNARDVEATASGSHANSSSRLSPTSSPINLSGDGMAISGGPSALHHHHHQQQVAVPVEAHIHPLSQVTKPLYPGLPSHGFDGIEEPPPYVHPPSHSTSSGVPQLRAQQAYQSEDVARVYGRRRSM